MSIILISGGLDSAVATKWALQNTEGPHIPLSFFYGQRHSRERICAEQLCQHYNLPQPRNINLAQAFAVIGGSSLTSGLVSGNPSTENVERTASDLPPSFVPGRNLIMLSFAAGIGYTEKAYNIVGGWNAVDYSGYPDCRPEFIAAFEAAANRALGFYQGEKLWMNIHAPLVYLTKEEIISLGKQLEVPFEKTWSCYAGGDSPCGECDSCKIRAEGFAAAGFADPALVTA